MTAALIERLEREAQAGPAIEHNFGAGVYIKRAVIPAGYAVRKHKHTYDHFSVVARGEVAVRIDGGPPRMYTAGDVVTIEANKVHEVEALTEAVWMCIHACDEGDAASIDNILIAGGAHAV